MADPELTIPRYIERTCPTCHNTNRAARRRCPTCRAKGKVLVVEDVPVDADIDDHRIAEQRKVLDQVEPAVVASDTTIDTVAPVRTRPCPECRNVSARARARCGTCDGTGRTTRP